MLPLSVGTRTHFPISPLLNRINEKVKFLPGVFVELSAKPRVGGWIKVGGWVRSIFGFFFLVERDGVLCFRAWALEGAQGRLRVPNGVACLLRCTDN